MIEAPERKLLPVNVTGTLEPAAPATGEIPERTGAGAETVKGTGPLVPEAVTTLMFRAPNGAFSAMAKVAVICVGLTMLMLLTVIPAPAFTVAPATKFVPVRVTGALVPATPAFGLMPVRVGGGGLMLKATAGDVPPEVVTVTLTGPHVAFAAMPKSR